MLNNSASETIVNVGPSNTQRRVEISRRIPTRRGIQNTRVRKPTKKSVSTLSTRISTYTKMKQLSGRNLSLSGTPKVVLQRAKRVSNSKSKVKTVLEFSSETKNEKIAQNLLWRMNLILNQL